MYDNTSKLATSPWSLSSRPIFWPLVRQLPAAPPTCRRVTPAALMAAVSSAADKISHVTGVTADIASAISDDLTIQEMMNEKHSPKGSHGGSSSSSKGDKGSTCTGIASDLTSIVSDGMTVDQLMNEKRSPKGRHGSRSHGFGSSTGDKISTGTNIASGLSGLFPAV